MTIESQISVIGVKEALAELNSVNKRYRRGVTIRYKQIMQPMISAAEHLVPVKAPMKGWNRAWDPRPGIQKNNTDDYNPDKQVLPWPDFMLKRVAYKPRPFLSGKRPKTFGGFTQNLTTMGIRWDGRFAPLFDMARTGHTPQGNQMIKVLAERYGAPSRAMWRAFDQAFPDVQDEIIQLVEEIMTAVGRNIKVQR